MDNGTSKLIHVRPETTDATPAIEIGNLSFSTLHINWPGVDRNWEVAMEEVSENGVGRKFCSRKLRPAQGFDFP